MRSFLFSFLFIFLAWTVPVFADLNPLLENHVKYSNIKITKVVSTDLIILENDERVSLIGIEGPRPPKFQDVKRDQHGFIIPDDDPTTSFEVEALRFAKTLLEGKVVRLEFDAERRNEEHVLVAYVFLPDNTLANEEILRKGYAQLKLRTPNMKYAQRLRQAYQVSRREMRGMQGNW